MVSSIIMKNGFDGLKPQSRSDKATYRKVDEDIMTQISYLIKEYPRLPATLVYQKLKDNGTIRSKEISLSTVNRVVNRTQKRRYTYKKQGYAKI